jgi:predicted lipoprotein with Yx(FWY)xxD motif
MGRVLVDRSGRALYTPDQEARGTVLCNGACTSFWKPLTTDGGAPTATADAGKLGTIARPDGTMQVTAGGKPLYTFVRDAPGKVTGNGFRDAFGGRRFTWRAVTAGGGTSSQSGGSGGGSRGYGGGGY